MNLRQLLAAALTAYMHVQGGATMHIAYDTSDAGPHHLQVSTVGGKPLVVAVSHVSVESALQAIAETAVIEAVGGVPAKQIEADAEAGAEGQAVAAAGQIITSQLASGMAAAATGDSSAVGRTPNIAELTNHD